MSDSVNIVNDKFSKISEYLIKIENNSEKNKLEFEIGLPIKWYIKGTNNIICECVAEIDDEGKIFKVYAEDDNVDEIFNFVIKTISTNIEIAEMERNFQDKVNLDKERIKKEVQEFYDKIEELREKSFENLDDEEALKDNMKLIFNLTEQLKSHEDKLNNIESND